MEIEFQAPGDAIRAMLEEKEWSQRDLAFVIGIPESAVNLLVTGKRGISPEMAKVLAKAFGTAPEHFINLQVKYELARAKEPSEGIERKAKLLTKAPVREMIKRGWLRESQDPDVLERRVLAFFGVESFDKMPVVAHAARRSVTAGNSYEEQTPAQLAWLYRVRQIAKEIDAPKYSEAALRSVLKDLRALLRAPEEAQHVPRLLSQSGVRFVIVEALPNSKIDGVCTWLDPSTPVIGLSLRFDRIDNFWFVLRHEIEHVLRKDGQGVAIPRIDADVTDVRAGLPEEERAANEAASAFCVPQEDFDSFINKKKPIPRERDLLDFASRHGLHPGLVAGQIRYRLKRWDLFNRHNAKVRSFVIPSAIVDGWGVEAFVGAERRKYDEVADASETPSSARGGERAGQSRSRGRRGVSSV